MGAIMQLQFGGSEVRFKYRKIEGVEAVEALPDYLVLDGQQRLTSIFRSLYSKVPVVTVNDQNKRIERLYYIDINKALSPDEDRFDAILSIPKDKKLKENFDRDIRLDLSSCELEFQEEFFPLNIIYDSSAREDWADGYKEYYEYSEEAREKYKQFRTKVIDTVISYKLPVITLDKNTPREAVCKVFENVNTGGVPLTVFELVTAGFAADGFDLREDWETYKKVIWGLSEPLRTDILNGVTETEYLTTITLYSNYLKKRNNAGSTSCKKRDVLNLPLDTYCSNRNAVVDGYKLARKFLLNQNVFRKYDLPYQTQLIPLAAICAFIGKSKFNEPSTQAILEQWYWCGIFGEMYGGANETRYANDIEDVVAEIEGEESLNRTKRAAFFSSTRLLSLQTRQSAAYKGVMALIYKASCQDLIKGSIMTAIRSMDEPSDIHHIFPQAYCESVGIPREKWNSIINKTPLLPESNRAIGGGAPSRYLVLIKKKAEIADSLLEERVKSHMIDFDELSNDNFDDYFIDRTKRLLDAIESAMGKSISDRGSEEAIRIYGCSLVR